MKSIPNKLTQDHFKRLLQGDQKYLPKKITDELKRAGMEKMLYDPEISKEKAMRAVKHLQETGHVSKFHPPSDLYRQAALGQVAQQEIDQKAIVAKNVKAHLRRDLDLEIDAMERGVLANKYDPRSVLGKSVVEMLDEEDQKRDKKIGSKNKKQDTTTPKSGSNKSRPQLIDIKNLPDLDIG